MSLTALGIQEHARDGQYFEADRWIDVSRTERIWRSILNYLPYFFSVDQACVSRSWKAIEAMPQVPPLIVRDIETAFDISRRPYQLTNAASRSIANIYAKTLAAQFNFSSIEVKQDPKLRLFTVTGVGEILSTVVNSDYGHLDFYSSDGFLNWRNRFDDLYRNDQTHLARVDFTRLVGPTANLLTRLFNREVRTDICKEPGKPFLTFAPEGDSSTFVFRDPTTQKMIAIATWDWVYASTSWYDWRQIQKWSITIAPNPSPLNQPSGYYVGVTLFVWAVLKHSQRYMPGTQECPYIKKWPPNG